MDEIDTTAIGQSLRVCRKAKGLTLEQVASAAGTDTGNLSRVERGMQTLTINMLGRIAHALGEKPVTFLVDGIISAAKDGNYFIGELDPNSPAGSYFTKEFTPGPSIKGTVPLISWVQAGHWQEAIDNLQPGEGAQVPTTYRVRPHTYALRVRGDSMEPKFPNGAIIIVEPGEHPEHGAYVIVRQNGDEATFKQLIQDGGRYFLKPLNPRYPIMEMAQDAVFCGVVKRLEMDV